MAKVLGEGTADEAGLLKGPIGSGGTPAASAETDLMTGEGVRVECEPVVSKACSAQGGALGTCGH